MKFVTQDSEYSEQVVVTFKGVDSVVAGHVWDELRLNPQDIRQLANSSDAHLRAWIEHMWLRAKR